MLSDLGSKTRLEAQELPDPSLVSETKCRPSKPNFWLCAGNTAWYDGFLIPKNLMEELINSSNLLPEVVKERDDYRLLLIESTNQRDSYKELYESEHTSYSSLNMETTRIIDQRDKVINDLEKSYKETEDLKSRLEKSHSTLEVSLISGSTAVVFAAVGVIVGIYVVD